MLLNCVNTMGEYLLTDLVIRHAEEQVASDPSLDKGQLIGEFYASFYFAVNVLTVVMQMFLVSRLFRWIGVNGALLVLPVIALIGYGLVAFLPIFGLLRVVKTLENSGNYSVMNTARQALFLPLPTIGKYEGKIATDTFFWRFGDLIPAAIVFVGLNWLDFGTQQFALVNIGLSLAWLAVAVRLAKRTPEQAPDRDAPAARRVPRARARSCVASRRSFSRAALRLGLPSRSGWLRWRAPPRPMQPPMAPHRELAGSVRRQRAAGRWSSLFDSKALCRNPQRETCVDLPATLLYRDAQARSNAWPSRCARAAVTWRYGAVRLAGVVRVLHGRHAQHAVRGREHAAPDDALRAHRRLRAVPTQGVLGVPDLQRADEQELARAARAHDLSRFCRADRAVRALRVLHGALRVVRAASRVTVRPKQLFDPRSADAMEIATLDLFEYAIGNTDWSVVKGHNMLLVEVRGGLVTPVPYDFDFSGLVDAEYASVSPKLGTSSVRQRIFRGVCRPDTDWDAAFGHFAARREAVLRLADEIPDLQPRAACRRHRLFESSFATFASPERRETEVIDACRAGEPR